MHGPTHPSRYSSEVSAHPVYEAWSQTFPSRYTIASQEGHHQDHMSNACGALNETPLQAIETQLSYFPEGSLDQHHSIRVRLQSDQVRSLITEELLDWTEAKSGCIIRFTEVQESDFDVRITGPIPEIYLAHTMVINLYHGGMFEDFTDDPIQRMQMVVSRVQGRLAEVTRSRAQEHRS